MGTESCAMKFTDLCKNAPREDEVILPLERRHVTVGDHLNVTMYDHRTCVVEADRTGWIAGIVFRIDLATRTAIGPIRFYYAD